MKKKFISRNLTICSILTTALTAANAGAGWNNAEAYRGYNQKFGDFPPLDIDQQLSNTTAEIDQSIQLSTQKTQPQAQQQLQPAPQAAPQSINNATVNTQQLPVQAPGGYVQQPAYGGYYQGSQPPGMQRYNRGYGFNGPWNNNRSNFSGPWNNRGSGFNGPWSNRGSSFNGPWNNRGSSFSGPWNNNGSSFSMPWGNNNGSGFRPWGNGGSWSWSLRRWYSIAR